MKRFKIALAALILTGGIVAAFAFTSKSSHKPFTNTTYYYKTGTCFQRIDANISDEDCKKSSLDVTTFENTANWTTTSNVSTFTDNNYIAAIEFNEGTGTGLLTLQQALNGVMTYYNNQSPKALPAENGSVTVSNGSDNVLVKIHRKLNVN